MELSPTESLLSAPGDNYSSLFSAASPNSATSPNTVNPLEMMTPKSTADVDGSVPETPGKDGDKKPAKKRKSWGQVLPEPKTNLPPRKRAKTEDEKEQRRVERVLRNRRAAQSSRERKRLEVEALEIRNQELETLLRSAQKANLLLIEELDKFRRDSGVVTRTSSPLDSLRAEANITLSPELFKATSDEAAPAATVNPASISPALAPVPDAAPQQPEAQPAKASATPDVTQHPAAMLSDLPCHMSASAPMNFPDWSPQLKTLLLSASAIVSACQRPLTQIALSSKAGFSLLPTPQLLTTIIWLVTLPPASHISPTSSSLTSTTSSTTRPPTSPLTLWQRATLPLRTTASTSRSTTLRVKSIRKILTSSPSLARPLMDATLVALRLVSGGRDDQLVSRESESCATREQDGELAQCLSGVELPSREVLLTLLWTLKMEEKKLSRRNSTSTSTTPSASGLTSERSVMAKKRLHSIGAARRRPRMH